MQDLILPRAEFDDDAPSPVKPGVVVDVLRSGLLQQDGRQLLDLRDASVERIVELLRELRREGIAAGRLSLQQRDDPEGAVEVVAEPLRIRAEKGAEWRLVENLMKGCSREDVAFWQVQLVLLEPPQ